MLFEDCGLDEFFFNLFTIMVMAFETAPSLFFKYIKSMYLNKITISFYFIWMTEGKVLFNVMIRCHVFQSSHTLRNPDLHASYAGLLLYTNSECLLCANCRKILTFPFLSRLRLVKKNIISLNEYCLLRQCLSEIH